MEQPTIVEVFNDDGTHSHWSLVETETGIKVWSENPIECKAQGYPVESPKKEYNGLPTDEELKKMAKDSIVVFHNHLESVNLDDLKYDEVQQEIFISAYLEGYKKSSQSTSSEIEALKAEIAELKKENDLFKAVAVEVANYSTSKTSALQLKKLAESVLKK